ncbi:hypothetical protein HWV62_16528 [Athelia sp. TMB]|nr:hypothetical protein HWV62_16528 [Athelia sp. TMB]
MVFQQGFPRDKMAYDMETFPKKAMRNYKAEINPPAGGRATSIPTFGIRAIEGWKKFVSPHTPQHIFYCSPSDLVREYVVFLLFSIVQIFEAEDRKRAEAASFQIAPLWPSIWVWLQILRAEGPESPPVDIAEEPRYPGEYNGPSMVVRVLHSFIYSPPQANLSTLVMTTPGLKEMVARMWLEEAADITASNGFRTSLLLRSDSVTEFFLTEVVAQCGGNTDAAVKVALLRIKRGMEQSEPDFSCSQHDIGILMHQLERHDTEVRILRQSILSHPTLIIAMVDTLSKLLTIQRAYPIHDLSDLLVLPLDVMFRRIQITGYDCVVQLMGTTILSVIIGLVQTCGFRPKVMDASAQLLRNIFCRFIAYRPILLATRDNLLAAGVTARHRSNSYIGQQITVLEDRIKALQYIMAFERQFVLDCGNPEVS